MAIRAEYPDSEMLYGVQMPTVAFQWSTTHPVEVEVEVNS